MTKKEKILIVGLILLVIFIGFLLYTLIKLNEINNSKTVNILNTDNSNTEKYSTPEPEITPELDPIEIIPSKVQLDVPYINEAPEGDWSGPWKNACEEASITMVEKFYQGKKEVSITEAKEYMIMLFNKQDEVWGSNTDADAIRAEQIINDYTLFNAEIRVNPEIEEIKKQLRQGNPVISLHYGKLLYNKNIPFLTTGTYYHMMVIIGYDDETEEFITNDDGDIKTGSAHRYEYDLFMNSLADFNFTRRAADGPPTVIFTKIK